MEIGLVVHPSNPVGDSIRLLTEFARRDGRTLIARESDAARVGPDVALVPEEAFVDRVDAIVALGGDGTMLGAMRLVVGRPVPVLGVNHGQRRLPRRGHPGRAAGRAEPARRRPVHAGAAQLPRRGLPGQRRGHGRVQRRGADRGRARSPGHSPPARC